MLTGIEITEKSLIVAQVVREGKKWALKKYQCIELPKGTITYAYRTRNIEDKAVFIDRLRTVLGAMQSKITKVGLSLPNEIIKVFVQSYEALPKTKVEIEKMLAWGAEKSLHVPENSLKVTYHLLGGSQKKSAQTLMVAIAVYDVIRDYEIMLRKCKIEPRIIRPSGINQFNYYAAMLPKKGIHAYLGLFEHYITFFVFEADQLLFYQGVKKGYLSEYYIDDFNMIMQYFTGENPNKSIENIYVGGCPRAYQQEITELIQHQFAQVVFLRHHEFMNKVLGGNATDAMVKWAPYLPAIGAAMSLAR